MIKVSAPPRGKPIPRSIALPRIDVSHAESPPLPPPHHKGVHARLRRAMGEGNGEICPPCNVSCNAATHADDGAANANQASEADRAAGGSPPPCGEGLGVGVVAHGTLDHFKHTIDIAKHVVVPESQYAVAVRLESLSVVRSASATVVDAC